jgi:hypothetical protein
MIRRGRAFLAAWTTAILAVVALSYASTKSIVMQAVDAGGMPVICSMQTDLAPAVIAAAQKVWLGHAPGTPGKGRPTACPFCSAAAHAPLLSAVASVAPPTAIRWVSRLPIAATEPRGRPLIRANARAPPFLPQNV